MQSTFENDFYLSTSESFFLLCSLQQHFSVLRAKRMKRVKRRIVRTQPTTTAIAINISGDKCSENINVQMFNNFKSCRKPLCTLAFYTLFMEGVHIQWKTLRLRFLRRFCSWVLSNWNDCERNTNKMEENSIQKTNLKMSQPTK